jgi:hypothetical protein
MDATIDNRTNDAPVTAATDIPGLLKFLAESDDLATGNKLLEPILSAAIGFYNRHDDDASCRALGITHGIVNININGPDETIVKGIVADMAVVASFRFGWIEGAGQHKQQQEGELSSHAGDGGDAFKRHLLHLVDGEDRTSAEMGDAETSDLVEELDGCRRRQFIAAEMVRRANLAGVPFAQWIADNLARLAADVPQSFKEQWAEWEGQARQFDLPVDQFFHIESSIQAQISVAELVRRGCGPEVWAPVGHRIRASSSSHAGEAGAGNGDDAGAGEADAGHAGAGQDHGDGCR